MKTKIVFKYNVFALFSSNTIQSVLHCVHLKCLPENTLFCTLRLKCNKLYFTLELTDCTLTMLHYDTTLKDEKKKIGINSLSTLREKNLSFSI